MDLKKNFSLNQFRNLVWNTLKQAEAYETDTVNLNSFLKSDTLTLELYYIANYLNFKI